jgi:hypothetical protein
VQYLGIVEVTSMKSVLAFIFSASFFTFFCILSSIFGLKLGNTDAFDEYALLY